MTTKASAYGYSSVNETFTTGRKPAGVKARSRSKAPPVNRMTGWPDGRFAFSMSRQKTPWRNPVPKALEHASFAAKRMA